MASPAAFLSPLSPGITTSRTRTIPRRDVARPYRLARQLTVRACAAPPPGQDTKPQDETDPLQPPFLSEQEPELNLDPKMLRWSEIPFGSIHEELDAIDEYQMQENLDENDCWPIFLRGAAYEYWGQPKLALAQYSKTKSAASLRQVPELWERRGYNAFKLGEVIASNAYFDISSLLLSEASGNHLHFMHWFHDNFKDYVPKRNGPPAPLQRAICKYCMGSLSQARDALVAQIADANYCLEHSILWLFAVAYRNGKENAISSSDYTLLREALDADFEWNPRLAKLIALFAAAAQNKPEDQAEAEIELAHAMEKDGDKFDITTHMYLALYHDAITGDPVKRDMELDLFDDIPSAPQTNDVENFLFHAAKNRFRVPPTAKTSEIPEYR